MDKNSFESGEKQEHSQANPSRHVPKKQGTPDLDPNIQNMLEKMNHMKTDLENQLTAIYEKGKKVGATSLIESSSQLNPTQFKIIKEQEKELNDKIESAIPPHSCIKKLPKSKEKLTQERKGKMRGARNQWIPVK